jgi:hypothetical protein
MTIQHRELASGRWNELSLVEQLGHIGSEVERALKWKGKNHPDYCMRAFERALELLDLTLACPAHRHRLREIARTREILVDFFCGENQFATTAKSLSAYFFRFACAARRSAP